MTDAERIKSLQKELDKANAFIKLQELEFENIIEKRIEHIRSDAFQTGLSEGRKLGINEVNSQMSDDISYRVVKEIRDTMYKDISSQISSFADISIPLGGLKVEYKNEMSIATQENISMFSIYYPANEIRIATRVPIGSYKGR